MEQNPFWRSNICWSSEEIPPLYHIMESELSLL